MYYYLFVGNKCIIICLLEIKVLLFVGNKCIICLLKINVLLFVCWK